MVETSVSNFDVTVAVMLYCCENYCSDDYLQYNRSIVGLGGYSFMPKISKITFVCDVKSNTETDVSTAATMERCAHLSNNAHLVLKMILYRLIGYRCTLITAFCCSVSTT